ncbi:hypothetical protein ACHQM5_029570 [Ranunculus cassubicifolius]
MASNSLPLPLYVLLSFLLLPSISNGVCFEFSTQFNTSDNQDNTNKANTDCKLRELNHYILVLRWMPSICTMETPTGICLTPVPTHIGIYALLPMDQYGDPLEYCGQDFDLFDNPSSDPDTQHFAQEWRKHGSCSGLSQAEYYRTGLELHKKENLLERLKDLGFGPHPTKGYNPSEIIAAYYEKYKVVMRLSCVRKSSSPLVEQIAEFHFKVNKETKTIESFAEKLNLCETTNAMFPDKYYSD